VHGSGAETPLTVEVSPEPALDMQNLLSVRVDKVLDENGNELKTPAPYISEPANYGGMAWAPVWTNSADYNPAGQDLSKRVSLRLHLPEGIKKLKEIRGSVAAEVLTPHQPLITVDDILHAADKKVAGADGGSVNVLDIKRDDKGQIVLRVVVEKAQTPQTAFALGMGMIAFPGGGIMGGGRPVVEPAPDAGVNAVAGILSLVDEKNQAFKLIAAEDQARDGQTNEYRLTFQPPSGAPKPAKLVYSGPRQTSIDVPFVLKDVPVRGDK
jgi:hypothetical protein